jgi:hypothetical protein
LTLKFVEEFSSVCSKNEKSFEHYFGFLMKITVYQGEPHAESVIRNVIQSITSIIVKGLPPNLLSIILEPLFERMKVLINIRYNWRICKGIVFLQQHTSADTDTSQTFFILVAQQLMCICSYLINPKKFKSTITEIYMNKAQGGHQSK